MLKPRIKHKVEELQEKQNPNKSIIFFILFIAIIYIGGSIINNYINNNLFAPRKQVDYKGIVFKLETDKDYYTIGEKVIIKLTLINESNQVVDIDFLSSDLAYFTVYSYVNLGLTKFYYKVWTTKPDIPIIPKVYRLSIKPKEKLTVVKVWDQVDKEGNPVKTGNYRFVAELNISERISLTK